jgi:hypothetical protein
MPALSVHHHVKVLLKNTNSPKVPLRELKNDPESGFLFISHWDNFKEF